MDAVPSGTGVFYQAMPAVGVDGKKIMKLIPVQMVNGQFVHTEISKARTDSTPQKDVSINISSVPVQMVKKAGSTPLNIQHVIRKQVSSVNPLPNQVGGHNDTTLNKHLLQQQTVNSTATEPDIAAHCGGLVRPSCQLPVTVKSPALPRGQYLQIPPNAQIQIVSGSELPLSIKKQIFSSSATCSSGSGLPSVVYVSPIVMVSPGVTPPCHSALDSFRLLSKTSRGPTSRGSEPHLKLIPKVSQRPDSPTKWVIEEEDSSAAPSRVNASSDTPEILRAVTERETVGKDCDVTSKTISQSSRGKSAPGQENALVVYNGKVFFVARKCSLPFKLGKSDSPTAATKIYELKKNTATSSPKSREPPAAEIQQDTSIIIPDESDEVIDLCDDEDSSQQAASVNMSAVPPLDEDNVIFVSYIPPKRESGSADTKTQMALEKETDQRGTGSSNDVTGEKSLAGRSGEGSALSGSRPEQSRLVSTGQHLTHVCGSVVMSVPDKEGSHVKSQPSCSAQRVESVEADLERESGVDPSTSDHSSGMCPQEEDTHTTESSSSPAPYCTSSLAPKSCQMADDLLRQTFGITANLKICLQRIEEGAAGSVPAEPVESVENQQEPGGGLKGDEPVMPDLYKSCENEETDFISGLNNIKRVQEQELSADPAAPAPHTDITPVKCFLSQLETNPLCALNNQFLLKGTSCNVETEAVSGYMEPIDEDFPSTDENNSPKSQDTAAQLQARTSVDVNTNTRGRGRTRKRTMCPCCTPGTRDPAVKSSLRLEEPEKRVWMSEQTTKKGTKASRKDGKTSGKISCLLAKNKQKCKAHEVPASLPALCLSAASVDYEELKQEEQIQRPKDLTEMEAASEMTTNSMS